MKKIDAIRTAAVIQTKWKERSRHINEETYTEQKWP